MDFSSFLDWFDLRIECQTGTAALDVTYSDEKCLFIIDVKASYLVDSRFFSFIFFWHSIGNELTGLVEDFLLLTEKMGDFCSSWLMGVMRLPVWML